MERKHYIDLLRVITVLLLVPYHTARIYDFVPFYIKDEPNMLMHLFAHSMHQWRMPILFLVSGVGTYFLLSSKNNNHFVKDRLTRLLVPFLFAVLVIVPPQGYIAVISKGIGDFKHYLDYFPAFFTFKLETIHGFTGTFTPAHMWFILYLVIFSLIAKPVYSWLKKQQDAFSNRPLSYRIYFFAIPLILARIVLLGMEMNPLFYFILFMYGFLLVREKAFEKAFEETRGFSLCFGVITMSTVLLLEYWGFSVGFEDPVSYVLFQTLYAVNTFLCVAAIIGYVQRYINTQYETIHQLNKNVFTIYILHQTYIVLAGFYIQKLNLSVTLSYFLILVFSYLGIYLSIRYIIRPIPFIRILFGSKA
ncbi:acyltransferase family protein [Pseudalkalibacillus sp. Hm43]|uniref:acyltransferase family protein n=1 Tax=Pseudalkalibacillus sp. Hm43 TaxID=3450742 RepID=UPI003F4354D2